MMYVLGRLTHTTMQTTKLHYTQLSMCKQYEPFQRSLEHNDTMGDAPAPS